MDWNEETIARLRQLWQDGHSTAEIGRRMGITKNAVVGKAHRLALTARPSPIRRGTQDGPRPRRSATRRMTGATLQGGSTQPGGSTQLGMAPSAPPVQRPVPLDAAVSSVADAPLAVPVRPAMPQPVMLRALPSIKPSARVSTCCWPIGDPGTPSFRFCDDGAMPNKPYCAEHAALAYVKVRDRREDAA